MNAKMLVSLGMGEKPAKIYLAGLVLGTTSVQELARKSGIKRPTVYLHLDDLVRQGFFELAPINKKNYYRATDPVVIEERMRKNLETLQHEMPQLEAMRGDLRGKPQVRILEGEEGVRQVYRELAKANSWRVWSNIGTEAHSMFNDLYEDLAEKVRENGIGIREIIADTKESRRYARLLAKITGPTYVARTATVEGLANDTIIYGNTVALFRLSGLNMFVVRIEDKTIADSLRAIFEMAWKTARPFK